MKLIIMGVFLNKYDCKDYSLINFCILNRFNWNLKVISLFYLYCFGKYFDLIR